jgi:hypothetical protein
MRNYLLNQSSASTMLVECFRRGDQREAGGILAERDGTRVITDAVPSTEHAERQRYTYYQSPEDVAYLNNVLRKLETLGRRFCGYFHRHPSGMTGLSQGDLDSCRQILKDPHYFLPDGLLMLIITESERSRIPIFPYLVRLEEDRPVVEPVTMTILPDDQVDRILSYFDASQPNRNNKEFHHEEVVHSGSGPLRPVFRPVRPGDRGRAYHQFDAARRELQEG